MDDFDSSTKLIFPEEVSLESLALEHPDLTDDQLLELYYELNGITEFYANGPLTPSEAEALRNEDIN